MYGEAHISHARYVDIRKYLDIKKAITVSKHSDSYKVLQELADVQVLISRVGLARASFSCGVLTARSSCYDIVL